MNSESRSLAVLIDGENTQHLPFIERVLAEAATHGTVTTRRIYGDWTSPEMSIWEKCLHSHGIETKQRFDYPDGSNAADITLIIDAMDMLHTGKVNGFCIVASDSHYTGLAMRIHRAKMFVVGIGSISNTSPSLQRECDVFRYVEELPRPDHPSGATSGWKETVKEAISMSAPEDGWVLLSVVIDNIRREIDPDFDPRTYCYTKKRLLIESCPEEFETAEGWDIGKPSGYHVRIRPARQ